MLLRVEEGVGGEVVVGGGAEVEVQGEDGEVVGVVGEAEVEEEEAGEEEVGGEEEEAEDQPGGRAAAITASMFRWNRPTPRCR